MDWIERYWKRLPGGPMPKERTIACILWLGVFILAAIVLIGIVT